MGSKENILLVKYDLWKFGVLLGVLTIFGFSICYLLAGTYDKISIVISTIFLFVSFVFLSYYYLALVGQYKNGK